ncbi:hypothetical protein ACJIZ3_013869 [Penstemon smallii]|uniref:Uncharacterized protein n=1 Tax=Penstemon smallii TaxID=265156 RepID=A0ABD3RLC7_9LAMI
MSENGFESRIEVGLVIIDSDSLEFFEAKPVNNLGELKNEEVPEEKKSPLSLSLDHCTSICRISSNLSLKEFV